VPHNAYSNIEMTKYWYENVKNIKDITFKKHIRHRQHRRCGCVKCTALSNDILAGRKKQQYNFITYVEMLANIREVVKQNRTNYEYQLNN
jgi:hypothetical protein